MLTFLLSLAACSPDDKLDDLPAEGTLTALTYNVHGLPPEITGDDTEARLLEIGPRLSAFDLVGLQEDFDDERHDQLAADADFDTEVRFNEALDDRFYGSGLAVLTTLTELDHHHEHFDDCYGTLDNAGDCLASKGFQAVRLQLGAGEVDVYNSHLEAGSGEEDDLARLNQIDQIVATMNGWSADRAVIFLGDTNLHPDEAPELAVVEDWMARAGLSDACAAVGCPESDHIDRIFYRDGGGVTLTVDAWTNHDPEFLDDAGEPLSDHEPLSADFSWAVE